MSSVVVDRAGPIVRVTLNRSDKLNALDLDVLERLLAAQRDIVERPGEARVMLLSGAGRAFCAGADLDYIKGVYTDPVASRHYLHTLRDAIVGLEQLPIPVIAAVHGMVLAGGLELLLGCDLAVAAESTKVSDQHMNWGFIPGGGSTQRLTHRIGAARARDLLYTGRWLSAREAADLGLVSRVVPDDEYLDAAGRLADDLATRSPYALSRIKALVHTAGVVPLTEGLDTEIEAVLSHYQQPEFSQSLQGFSNRQIPRF
jgi:enoyl-CoA hydratase